MTQFTAKQIECCDHLFSENRLKNSFNMKNLNERQYTNEMDLYESFMTF